MASAATTLRISITLGNSSTDRIFAGQPISRTNVVLPRHSSSSGRSSFVLTFSRRRTNRANSPLTSSNKKKKKMEQSSRRTRMKWTMDMVKTFLETCIQEVSLNGRYRGSLKLESWNKVSLALQKFHGVILTQKQLKNHYDYVKTKYQYQALSPITQKTGNVYDPISSTIRMSNSEWDEYIKAHPKAEYLKTLPLPFPDLCKALFDSATATGINGWSPSCTFPRPGASISSDPIDVDTLDGAEYLVGEKSKVPNDSSQSSVTIERKSLGKKKKTSNMLTFSKKKKKKTSSQLDIDEKMSIALELLIKKSSGLDFEECMDKLEGLRWEEPLYTAAVTILCEGECYRKAWMRITEVDKLVCLITTVGRQKGLI